MAKVTQPLGSGEARGKVGNLIYNTWRGIRTVRTCTPPDHEDDPKRVAHKLIVQAAAQRWRDLTGAERAAWTAYADVHLDLDWTGSPKRLAGYHWYVRVQTKRKDLDQDYLDTPPTSEITCNLGNLSLSAFYGDIYLNWQKIGTYDPDTTMVDVWQTALHSPGRSPTLHEATHMLYDHMSSDMTYVGFNVGDTATLFARPVTLAGLTGPWSKLKFTVPEPP